MTVGDGQGTASATNESSLTNQPSSTDSAERPFFSILGSVDGIRDELVPNHGSHEDDDNSWILQPIIVECKNRMRRLQSTPPLYEQIQTVVYCQMYQVEEADIVQVLQQEATTEPKKRKSAQNRPRKSPSKKKEKVDSRQTLMDTFVTSSASTDNDSGVQSKEQIVEATVLSSETREGPVVDCTVEVKPIDSIEQVAEEKENSDVDQKPPSDSHREDGPDRPPPIISVSRVSLNDPILQHRSNWTHIILPRLCSFVEAVYRIRSTDDLRYQLLMASDPNRDGQRAWELLHEQCPWLLDCDTAYHRR